MKVNKEKYFAFCLDVWSECNNKHKAIKISKLVSLHRVSYGYFIFLMDEKIISKIGNGKGSKFMWVTEEPTKEFVEVSIDIWQEGMDDKDDALITQFRGHKSANSLVLNNYDRYIDTLKNNESNYYKRGHEILRDLEEEVSYDDNPDRVILISYKEWGGVIFEQLKRKKRDKSYEFIYEYSGIVS